MECFCLFVCHLLDTTATTESLREGQHLLLQEKYQKKVNKCDMNFLKWLEWCRTLMRYFYKVQQIWEKKSVLIHRIIIVRYKLNWRVFSKAKWKIFQEEKEAISSHISFTNMHLTITVRLHLIVRVYPQETACPWTKVCISSGHIIHKKEHLLWIYLRIFVKRIYVRGGCPY